MLPFPTRLLQRLLRAIGHSGSDAHSLFEEHPRQRDGRSNPPVIPWVDEEAFISILRKHASPAFDALEMGCGKGAITSHASWLFHHLYATDASKKVLPGHKRSSMFDNISFHHIDNHSLREFADSSIDFVFSFNFFGQFNSFQVYSYLKEIYRVLKEDSVALIAFNGFLQRFEDFKEMSFNLDDRNLRRNARNIHYVTEEMISHMLTDLGFRILEVDRTRRLIIAFTRSPDGPAQSVTGQNTAHPVLRVPQRSPVVISAMPILLPPVER